MPRIPISLLLFLVGTLATANAEPIRISPDPCPIPADIAPLISDDVKAYELNDWTDRLDELLLFRDIPVAGGALALRVYPDPATGEVYEFATAPVSCQKDESVPQ